MSAIDITRCLIVSPAHDPQLPAVMASRTMLKELGSKDVTVWSGYSNSHASVFDHQPTYVMDFGFLNPVDTLQNLLRYEKPIMIDVFMALFESWRLYSPREDGSFPINEDAWVIRRMRDANASFYRAGDNDTESNFIQLNEPRRLIRIPSRHYRGPCI
jgi:hypothetical protein